MNEVIGEALKFGDIIENQDLSKDNPRRICVVVKSRPYSLMCTDTKGCFWDLIVTPESSFKVLGSVLNDNYENIIKSLK